MPERCDGFGTPDAPLSRLEALFWRYHAEHPHVYELFDRFTRDSIKAGRRNFSADVVAHRIRWATMIEAGDGDFKVNNNFVAYYARLWMRNNPQHQGFFRTRTVIGDRT